MINQLRDAFNHDARLWHRWRARFRALARPGAAQHITAQHIAAQHIAPQHIAPQRISAHVLS